MTEAHAQNVGSFGSARFVVVDSNLNTIHLSLTPCHYVLPVFYPFFHPLPRKSHCRQRLFHNCPLKYCNWSTRSKCRKFRISSVCCCRLQSQYHPSQPHSLPLCTSRLLSILPSTTMKKPLQAVHCGILCTMGPKPFINSQFNIHSHNLSESTKYKLCFETKMTKVYSKNLLMKSSKNNFIFLLVFYLIMCLMKAPKNFGKIAILKIWELISLGGVKTHFGKLALKWCIFRHETKIL